jgi:hypothetical protein
LEKGLICFNVRGSALRHGKSGYECVASSSETHDPQRNRRGHFKGLLLPSGTDLSCESSHAGVLLSCFTRSTILWMTAEKTICLFAHCRLISPSSKSRSREASPHISLPAYYKLSRRYPIRLIQTDAADHAVPKFSNFRFRYFPK